MELEQMHDTREGWLSHAVGLMSRRLSEKGFTLPDKLKVACGFPMGSRGSKKVLAQCIAPEASAEGITEVFISPTISDPVEVLGAVLVMTGHAAGKGKGNAFKAFAIAMGLVGKAAEARPGTATAEWLREEVLPMLGAYPHAAVDPSQRKKQGTRMIKLECPETGYTVRTTKKWLALGVPKSPVNADGKGGCDMVVVADDNGEE